MGGALVDRRRIVYVGDDVMVRRTLDRTATEFGLDVVGPAGAADAAAVLMVVIDVDSDEGTAQVAPWRRRCPAAAVVGHVSQLDPTRWQTAERAGCDAVVTRGAIGPRLRHWFASGETRRHRMALFDSADVAGRLGLIQRVDATPVGPLAVFRVGEALYGIEDRCPHAGSRLSDGTSDGQVVTCPGHGSQFDITTGERVRGPADAGLRSYRLEDENGRVYLEWAGPTR